MQIESYKSLASYNTFGIDCKARFFVSVETIEDLKKALAEPIHPELFILGGGSNMLLTDDIDALVMHVNLKGITVVKEDDTHVWLEAMAGENWHELVMYCLQNDFGGIENLALIPGNVGTAPIQNIGAYGVELKDVFERCDVVEIETQEEHTLDREACQFGYRNSIFKGEAKGRYIVTRMVMKLSKAPHALNTSYGAISSELEARGITDPGIADVAQAVMTIRQSKLPDPAVLGNSGSFFKNPVLDAEAFRNFRMAYPEAPFYEVSPTEFKVPAGWLIEQAGFKGKRFGDAGVHDKQALVLVNHGNATGTEIWELAQKIQQKIKETFGIYLEPEVNVI